MPFDREQYEALKSREQAETQDTGFDRSMYEQLKQREMQEAVDTPSTDLGAMRFEPEVQPAVSTAVSPEYGQVPAPEGMPSFGLLPKGTGEKFEKALPQWPVTEGMGAGQKVLRTAGNLGLGAAKFPVRMGTGVLEEPLRVPEALARFIPSVINRLSTAAPGAGRRRFGAEFTGREPSKLTEEQVGQARRELMEEPFDVALLAAPLLKALKAPRIKAPKPKPVAAPVVEAVKAKKAVPPMTYDEFSTSRGVPTTPPDFSYVHKKPGKVSKPSERALQKRQLAANEKWQAGRDRLRAEYDKLVNEGKLREPTRIEKLERTAASEQPSEAREAARRLLKKKKAPPKPTKAAKEPWEMTRGEYRRQRLEPITGVQRGLPTNEGVRYIDATHKKIVKQVLSEGKPVPVEVLKDYPDLAKKAPALLQGEKGKVVGKKEVLGKPTELGFMGVTPESMKALGEPVAKAMRSVSASTSQMIKGVKAKPEIVKGVKVFKETVTEHDRFIRQSEATSRLLKRVTEKAVPNKDRQMLMVHAYEHKMKGKYWDQLSGAEKTLVRSLAQEKVKLNQFIKENKVLEMMPESEKISHIFHHWLDPKTKQPFKAMYGRLSKGLPQAKQRTIPTYEAGIAKGMKPATQNLGELIGLEWEAAMRAHQSRQMIKSIYNIEAEKGASIKLTVKGKPHPISMLERWDLLEKQGLTEGYKRYSHYALDKPMIFKDNAGNLVRIKGPVGVREEIYPHLHAYMENPTYNAFDNLISVSRSAKLGLSMFHAVSLGMQEAALSLGKLVTGHPVAFARRIPFTAIPRGLKYRKEMGPVERLLYQEGLELFRHSEQMGGERFFRGVGIPSKAGNILTAPVKLGRDFIFGVVQPGMKTAFAHDTFLSMLPKYLKGTGWTKEAVITAYDAGKTIPKEVLKCARQAVQMADGHFSGEHWRRSLLETNRFMAKAYFSPGAQTAWNRGLLSKTWQREHMLVAKNVAKSFMPQKLISKIKLAEIHPSAKAEYRQYLYGAVAVVGAVDLWNLMSTERMDGEAKHLWQNPEGKGFAVRAPWNEPDYTVTDKNGKERTIKGGPAYIRPLKSLFEVAEWVHHPVRKFSYKLAPYVSAIIAQMPNNKYRNYEGMKDVPKRAMDFMFDTFEPISVTQLVDVARGRKEWPAAVFPFLGMPTSKLKMPKKETAWEKKPSTSRSRQRPASRR